MVLFAYYQYVGFRGTDKHYLFEHSGHLGALVEHWTHDHKVVGTSTDWSSCVESLSKILNHIGSRYPGEKKGKKRNGYWQISFWEDKTDSFAQEEVAYPAFVQFIHSPLFP